MSDRGEIFEFGQFSVNVRRRSLEREGQAVALSGKAFEILSPTFAVADIFQFFVMIFVLKSCVFIIGI
jgi:hypothetical protein